MPNIVRALLCAALMLLVAFAGRTGWIDDGFATGLMVALPALMVLTLRRRGCGNCSVSV